MRLTNKLYAQHLGWMFKKHWQVQGKRVPKDTGALAELEKLGIKVKDPKDIIKENVDFKPFEVVGNKLNTQAADETHPDWHAEQCYVYGNKHILVEGIPQAQVLTNTLEINNLPENVLDVFKKVQIPSSVDKSIQNSIKAAHIFDTEQVKLPKVKNPERPTQNPPREYGISSERKNHLLINNLILECERIAGHTMTSRRKLVNGADFKVTLRRNNDLLQFAVTAETFLIAMRPLTEKKAFVDAALPELYPISCTITLPKKNIYSTATFYPFSPDILHGHPHTIFLHFNKEKVANIHNTNVTSSQFQSRNMLKAFTVAAARAKQLYGDAGIQNLEKPIVVQSIQSDGRKFHFGVFQLNTLSLANNENRNIWFHQPSIDLFEECAYKEGKPMLMGYNKDVFRYINAFYQSI